MTTSEAAPRARGETPVAWLVAAALGAAGLHQLMLLVPVALVTLLPGLLFDSTLFRVVGVGAFVFLAWVVQPSWRSEMRLLTRAQAPRLHARVDAMTDAIGAPRVHGIVLEGDLNAGALEQHRGVSLRRTRRVLVLGLPLLRLLDTAAAEAVIAHELGHFSRRHGRLGHWLYRTRAAWAGWAASVGTEVEDSTPWDRAGASFAMLFLPWFRRASEAHMRRCEFEADAIAAQWASPRALARALLVMEVSSMRAGGAPDGASLDELRSSASPTRQWVERPARTLLDQPATPEEIAEALRHRQAHGSHPPHRQRIDALGVDAAGLDLSPASWNESAAAHWLGADWDALCADAGPWSGTGERLAWAMAHAALTGIDPVALGASPVREAMDAQAFRRLERRHRAVWAALEQGRGQPVSLAPWRREAIARALVANEAIAQAWLFDVPVAVQGQPASMDTGVVLRVDPRRMEALGLNLEQVTRTLSLTMALLLPDGQAWAPRCSYTTEGLPPELQARVDVTPPLKG
ncbi:M48 family metallopeptidase [Roseateles chitosanitabidus]|uniref:M48 family metallopeptidase n=1 Tax=Roseateles chitosanitabidus TaxID=65048 RepID=UPI0009FCAA25|nr:M48 family metallopeptidase [Roseateles chitosanitabidus]